MTKPQQRRFPHLTHSLQQEIQGKTPKVFSNGEFGPGWHALESSQGMQI